MWICGPCYKYVDIAKTYTSYVTLTVKYIITVHLGV